MRRTVRTRVQVFGPHGPIRTKVDKVVGEAPLEIRIDGEPFTVVMRTPGQDTEHVLGLLLGEGIITCRHDVIDIDFSTGLDPDGSRNYNVARVRLRAVNRVAVRNVYTSSACGICGTAAIEAVTKTSAYPLDPPGQGVRFDPAALCQLPDLLRDQQPLFASTGGIHAAGLFDLGAGVGHNPNQPNAQGSTQPNGQAGGPGMGLRPRAIAVAEDVGRHNAVDKVLGVAVRDGLVPLAGCVLQVSSRASFELVQKAAMAGVPVLSAVSAPSSAAVELGQELGVTVIGFNRKGTFNAYSAPERIAGS